MEMPSTLRSFLAILTGGASLALTLAWFTESLKLSAASDAMLVAGFTGAAFEDIFGLGFFPTLAAIAVLQFALVGGCWLSLRNHRTRSLVPLLVVAFMLTSLFSFHCYQRQYGLWFSQASH